MHTVVWGKQQIMIAKPHEHYSLLKSCNFVQVAKYNNPILQNNLQSTNMSPLMFQCETAQQIKMFQYGTSLV